MIDALVGAEQGTLNVSRELLRLVRGKAEEAYPEECCGVLVGAIGGSEVVVQQAVPTSNGSQNPASGYEIPAVELAKAVSKARASGAEVVGYYHSHPDRHPQPSSRDRRAAWPGVSYLIVSVHDGIAGEINSWRMTKSGAFEAERIVDSGRRRLRKEVG